MTGKVSLIIMLAGPDVLSSFATLNLELNSSDKSLIKGKKSKVPEAANQICLCLLSKTPIVKHATANKVNIETIEITQWFL